MLRVDVLQLYSEGGHLSSFTPRPHKRFWRGEKGLPDEQAPMG